MSDACVEITEPEARIAQIRMRDQMNKNAFTDELVRDLRDAFETVTGRPDYKVVVLTGYGNYFSSGGTQQGLRALYEGRVQFTDTGLYSLPLECPVPVIAAMQGHSVGGGFVLGMFADMAVLAREAVYTVNFMKYGFTPGMGATFILPRQLGNALANEMMLGAMIYRGSELGDRGIPFPVVPRQEVPGHALDLARTLAEKPRVSLVKLKYHLASSVRNELPRIIEQELDMHEQTLSQPEVRERIETFFGA